MSPDLFRQVVERRPSAAGGRLSALPVSILAHALALAALVVIPLLASDVLPLVQDSGALPMPVVVVPTAPPVPAPASRHAAPAATVSPNAPPVEPPSGIVREGLIASPEPPDVAAPQARGEVPGDGPPAGFDTVFRDAPPPPKPDVPVRVSTLIRPPVKIRDVSPVYPTAAVLARVEGVVVIEAVIGQTGDVREARILRSHPLLDEAAVAAVRQWRYTPTLLNGVPVPVVMTVTVRFALQ